MPYSFKNNSFGFQLFYNIENNIRIIFVWKFDYHTMSLNSASVYLKFSDFRVRFPYIISCIDVINNNISFLNLTHTFSLNIKASAAPWREGRTSGAALWTTAQEELDHLCWPRVFGPIHINLGIIILYEFIYNQNKNNCFICTIVIFVWTYTLSRKSHSCHKTRNCLSENCETISIKNTQFIELPN